MDKVDKPDGSVNKKSGTSSLPYRPLMMAGILAIAIALILSAISVILGFSADLVQGNAYLVQGNGTGSTSSESATLTAMIVMGILAGLILIIIAVWVVVLGIKMHLPERYIGIGLFLFLFFVFLAVGGYLYASLWSALLSGSGSGLPNGEAGQFTGDITLYSTLLLIGGVFVLISSILASSKSTGARITAGILGLISAIFVYLGMSFSWIDAYSSIIGFSISTLTGGNTGTSYLYYVDSSYIPFNYFIFGIMGSYGIMALIAAIAAIVILIVAHFLSEGSVKKTVEAITMVPVIIYAIGSVITGAMIVSLKFFNDLSFFTGTIFSYKSSAVSLLKANQAVGYTSGWVMIIGGILIMVGAALLLVTLLMDVMPKDLFSTSATPKGTSASAKKPARSATTYDRLAELKKMKDEGLINDDDFEKQKTKILEER